MNKFLIIFAVMLSITACEKKEHLNPDGETSGTVEITVD